MSLNSQYKHGYAGTPIYNRWAGMKARCHNPNDKNWANYGGRGITVCDRWLYSFENFISDMGDVPFPGAQIDRIDNNKGYSPDNCRWVTSKINSQNTRFTVFLTHNGETLCLLDWAKKVGINHRTLDYRIKNGWSHEKALTTKPAFKNQDYKKRKLVNVP